MQQLLWAVVVVCPFLTTALRSSGLESFQWKPTQCGPGNIITQWGTTVDPDNVLPEYPRPQLDRSTTSPWKTLNGLWEYQGYASQPNIPFGSNLSSVILVPFPVESCLSGIGQTYQHMLYRLVFDSPFSGVNPVVRIHFGAVDWYTEVYMNQKFVTNHTGGYDGFSADVTLLPKGNELFVRVFDPSDNGAQPNGKQRISAIVNPGGDTYTPSSGIWQTVWLESLPATYVSELKIDTTLTTVNFTVHSSAGSAASVSITVYRGSHATANVSGASSGTAINIPIPNPRLWSPTDPFLYTATIKLCVGSACDVVTTYFGLRTVGLGKHEKRPGTPPTGPQQGIDRPGNDLPNMPITLPTGSGADVCWGKCNTTSGCNAWAFGIPNCGGAGSAPLCWLKNTQATGTTTNVCRVSGAQKSPPYYTSRPTINGDFIFFAGWLDQSWWPDGLYTAPTDAALRFDLDSIKTFGLNTVRLHQKVNSERWYYYADKLGIIVLQDMIQKYGGATAATVPLFMNDLKAMITGRWNHPSIVQWDVFNEFDDVQVFNATYVVNWVRAFDPSRLVDTNSGGPANDLHIADVNDIHTYPWPGTPQPSLTQYAMLGEFGGVGAFVNGHEWVPQQCTTYLQVPTPQDEANTYVQMIQKVIGDRGDISACIYTQITDVERECDGFLNMDRTNKFNSSQMESIVAVNQKLIHGG